MGNLILAPSDRQVAAEASSGIPRTGPSKILRIFVSTIDDFAQSVSLCVTTDTYIAEVLEQVCKKKRLEKTYFILKLHQKNILAPLDRTVESLGENTDLDLVRRKFTTDGLGDRPGSPSSADPNSKWEGGKGMEGRDADGNVGGGGSAVVDQQSYRVEEEKAAAAPWDDAGCDL